MIEFSTSLQHGGSSYCRDFYLQGFLNLWVRKSDLLLVITPRNSGSRVRSFGFYKHKNTNQSWNFMWLMIVFLPFLLRIVDFFPLMGENFSKTVWWHLFFPQAQPQIFPKNTHSRLSHQGPLHGQPMFWYKGTQTEAVGEMAQLLPSFMRGGRYMF